MPLYYFEQNDPEQPGKKTRHYISDDELNLDDLIYSIPGGIENISTIRTIMAAMSADMKEIFLQKITGKLEEKGFSVKEEPRKQMYEDEELNRIVSQNEPRNLMVMSNTPSDDDTKHIRIDTPYQPQPVRIDKLVDFHALPAMKSMDTAEQQ